MPEIDFKKPIFTYGAFEPFIKNKEKIEKFEEEEI